VAEIDRVLPEWDVNEVHEIVLESTPERALAAALATPAAPDRVVGMLLRLRGVSARGSVEELLGAIGFEQVARSPIEVVFAGAGQPWRPSGRIAPLADAGAGTVRVAASFRVEEARDGRSRLSTETRIAAVDSPARRSFGRYWRVVGPFSALIRRRWLRAVRRSLAS